MFHTCKACLFNPSPPPKHSLLICCHTWPSTLAFIILVTNNYVGVGISLRYGYNSCTDARILTLFIAEDWLVYVIRFALVIVLRDYMHVLLFVYTFFGCLIASSSGLPAAARRSKGDWTASHQLASWASLVFCRVRCTDRTFYRCCVPVAHVVAVLLKCMIFSLVIVVAVFV